VERSRIVGKQALGVVERLAFRRGKTRRAVRGTKSGSMAGVRPGWACAW
jgi:hypothetical protein